MSKDLTKSIDQVKSAAIKQAHSARQKEGFEKVKFKWATGTMKFNTEKVDEEGNMPAPPPRPSRALRRLTYTSMKNLRTPDHEVIGF